MPHEHLTTPLEDLDARVKELERRLSALECASIAARPLQDAPIPALTPQGPSTALRNETQPGIFPVLGKVILGIAGGYILRAAAESGVFHPVIIVTAALVYAAAWLVWASGSHSGGKFACYSYAITAALILSPMLWEVTVRFRLLEPSVTAAVLGAFAVLAFALSWHRDDSHIVWPGVLSAVITALVLMPATRALVPFTMALLFMTLLAEFAADCGRWLGLRPVVAAAADLACFLLVLILGDSLEIPPEYNPASPAVVLALVIGLFAIYALSAIVRSIVLRLRISALESTQLAITVLLAVWGVLRVTHGSGALTLGIISLSAGSICYLTAFAFLARRTERVNFHFYSGWGLALVLIGSFFTLPNSPLVVGLCLAAAGTTALGVIGRNPTLDFHGVVYLGAAVYASHLLEYAAGALAGTHPSLPTGIGALHSRGNSSLQCNRLAVSGGAMDGSIPAASPCNSCGIFGSRSRCRYDCLADGTRRVFGTSSVGSHPHRSNMRGGATLSLRRLALESARICVDGVRSRSPRRFQAGY